MRAIPGLSSAARAGSRLGIAGLLVLLASNALQSAVAEGDTRTLTMHHVHTGEDITITYKRDGQYVPSALKKLDWFMRDWRKQKETNMDPRLFDILWDVYRESGATRPIEIICGYRSPSTNAMLHRRSSGVAEHSQHTLGRAIDFFIPSVPLAKLRALGLHLEWGGVGYYPRSGSPFVHMDVGLVRHWPNIARHDLQKIFPNGRTVHIPADGKPLRNYALALADVERRGNAPNRRSLDAARAAGVISEGQVQEAMLIATHPHQGRTLLASLFSGPASRPASATLSADSMMAPIASKQSRAHARQAPIQLASARAPQGVAAKPAHHSRAVPPPLPLPRPTLTAQAEPSPTAEPVKTASLTGGMASSGIIWGDVLASDRSARAAASPFDVAAATTTGDDALAYAAQSDPTPVARVRPLLRPMGAKVPRLPREAAVIPAGGDTTVAVKPPKSNLSIGGQRGDSPWLRAAMLTPSVSDYMTATQLGHADPRWLQALMQKPAQAVMMSFSADPSSGMVAERFTGHAVMFLATATFAPPTALTLR